MFTNRFYRLPGLLHFIPLTLLLLGTAILAYGAIDRPNVIIIFTDDQGYEDLSSFGSPDIDTPELDRMADEGLRLTDFHVSSSVCSASRASLLTGRKPLHHGVFGAIFPNSSGLNNNEQTIADMLKATGYSTALFGKWHLGEKTSEDLPMGFGFDTYFGIPYSNDMYISSSIDFANDAVFRDGYNLAQAQAEQNDKNLRVKDNVPLVEGDLIVEYPADQASLTRRYIDRAISQIDTVTASDPENPFFIYIAPAMPHIPLFASPEFEGTSERGRYGDVIEEIDFHVGRLLDHLQASGLDERTMVIFTSDNGPWLGVGAATGDSFPYVGGKFQVDEGATRVPCVMWWPGTWKAGQVSKHLVSTVDLLPTVAHYAGATLPDVYIAGFNVSHHLENTALATGKPYDVVQVSKAASLRQGPWKYQPDGIRGEGPPGLFDLEVDPGQEVNLYSVEPLVVSALQADYEEFFATASAPVDNQAPTAPANGTATAGPRSVVLDWPTNAEPDLSHYIVYRSSTSGGPYHPISLTEDAAYTDAEPSLGGANYYAVKAVDDRGNQSLFGAEMSAIPLDTLPGDEVLLAEFDFTIAANAPAILGASSLHSEVDLVRGLSRNDLGLSGQGTLDNQWSLSTTLPNATLEDVLGSNDALYLDFVLGEVEGYGVQVSRVDIDFYREGAESPTTYHLFSDKDGFTTEAVLEQASFAGTAPTTFSQSQVWVGLDASTTFRLYMSGNQAATGNTHFTGVSVYGVVSDLPPLPPQALATESFEAGEVELAWQAVEDDDVMTYNVYRLLEGESDYSLIGSNLVSPAYADTGLPERSTVGYKVSSVDAAGQESELSGAVLIVVQETLVATGSIDIIGNTNGAQGGEFADYSDLNDGASWGDSADIDAELRLSVSRSSLNGEVSSSGWKSNYVGVNAEINFGTGNASQSTALGDRNFIAIQLESRRAEEGERFSMDSLSVSLWRNGGAAADVYQLAYDFAGDGFDAGDFIGTPVINEGGGTDDTFTVTNALSTDLANQHEVRLYFWNRSGSGGNSHLFEVTAEYTLESELNGEPRIESEIDILGSTTQGAGGEFADYSGLGIGAEWGASSESDDTLFLRVTRVGASGAPSGSAWNDNGYPGAGTEINFTKASESASSFVEANAENAYVAIQLDSTPLASTPFAVESVSLSLWRNGGQAADVYQLAYDRSNNGFDQSDLLGTPVNNAESGTTNPFTVSANLNTGFSDQHEVRLYFWKAAGDGVSIANTHLFEVRAVYSVQISFFTAWAEQFGGTEMIGAADADYDGDGVSNFLEYALNGDPTSSSDKGTVDVALDQTVFSISYAKHQNDESLNYNVLDRMDLNAVEPGVNRYTSTSPGETNGDYIMIEHHYPMNAAEQRFFQIEVIENP